MSPHYIHAKIHGRLFRILEDNMSDCDWLIDFDYYYSEKDKVRPDIVGLRNSEPYVFVEISDSTFERDAKAKFGLYQGLEVPYYIWINCQDLQILKYKLNVEGSFQPTDELEFVSNDIFKILKK